MSDYQRSASSGSAREQELEIEVARLQAELDALRGEDPTTATSRFLAMAAATVDQAVEDARREADEIVEEISAEAEARRDEATRVAAEAEAMAEQLLADADRAEERIEEANAEAEAIKSAAEEEAEQLVTAERQKVAVEAEALDEVRASLETERAALDSYHEQLHRRVQELAESMVSFMSTELPGGGTAIGNIGVPQLESVLATAAPETVDAEPDEISEIDDVVVDDGDDNMVETDDETDDEVATVATGEDTGVVDEDPLDAMPVPPEVAETDAWTEMLESAIPAAESYPDAMEMPADAIDEIPPGPPSTFGDHEIVESTVEDDESAVPSSSGLFSRAAEDESDSTGSAEGDAPEKESTGLFGMLGSRLVQQTPPDELAEALEEENGEDQAFHEFLAGDDEPDPSRDWLLRPEHG